MKIYPISERVDMIMTIGECYENCFMASRLYAQKFPEREHPNRRSMEKLLTRFRATGSTAYTKQNKTKPVTRNEENEFMVIGSVVENRHTSSRIIERETNISRYTVRTILKRNNYHPFHIQIHQQLYVNDFQRRIDFCLWALEQVGDDNNFFKFVLFSDECTFHSNGVVNRHNFHYYDTVNRHEFNTIDRQHRWSLNVYGGIINDYVIGPYFFDGHLNGVTFLRFLKNDFKFLLENVPLNVRAKMWLQLDGAPAHYLQAVRRYLDRIFPNRWIGRNGPCNWPARSPDLTSLDFFFWGYIKNIAYSVPPTTRNNMKDQIINAFATVTPEMLANVRRSFEDRIRLCIQENGSHFEHLL